MLCIWAGWKWGNNYTTMLSDTTPSTFTLKEISIFSLHSQIFLLIIPQAFAHHSQLIIYYAGTCKLGVLVTKNFGNRLVGDGPTAEFLFNIAVTMVSENRIRLNNGPPISPNDIQGDWPRPRPSHIFPSYRWKKTLKRGISGGSKSFFLLQN